jgi:signal transduction histidine kinase
LSGTTRWQSWRWRSTIWHASLEHLEDTRRTFLANVSHDLRTPMTSIGGFIDGILDGTIPPEKHTEYLTRCSNEVKRLSRLVASLLDITRIQAGERKFNKTSFDICEMAREILISFEKRIEDKHLDVEFDCEADKMLAVADRDAIYQVLYNICDNAVKFSREGGKYRIRITSKDKKINVSVYNEGQGIPEEDLAIVFDRFYKSDKSRGLDKSGVGSGPLHRKNYYRRARRGNQGAQRLGTILRVYFHPHKRKIAGESSFSPAILFFIRMLCFCALFT